MGFPSAISFTITNRCNLKCRMCGQWSREGYMHGRRDCLAQEMGLADWKRLVDEVADHGVPSVLLRGGEPFLFPGIVALLEHLRARGVAASIDTNGTLLARYAEDVARIGGIHLTISVDGPEEVHDHVRGVAGCFARVREGVERLHEVERRTGRGVSASINFTISPYSIAGLGRLPDVARSLGIGTLCIVPYYYVPEHVGRQYERVLLEHLQCAGFTWHGFHHEESGVDLREFERQYAEFRATLGDLHAFPYMPLSDDEYRTWFADAETPVGSTRCTNVEKLIDIQPGGDANFCVDFPDYTFGNVREHTIEDVWNGERAEQFRRYRRREPLPVCHRCGAKRMSEIGG